MSRGWFKTSNLLLGAVLIFFWGGCTPRLQTHPSVEQRINSLKEHWKQSGTAEEKENNKATQNNKINKKAGTDE